MLLIRFIISSMLASPTSGSSAYKGYLYLYTTKSKLKSLRQKIIKVISFVIGYRQTRKLRRNLVFGRSAVIIGSSD